MKVFLTGGTGFIGQPLTKALAARGWEVLALVRRPDSPQAQALTALGAKLVTGDITQRESMRTAMNGAGIVVHNAGHYEYGVDHAGKQRMHAINVTGTEHVLGLAHELDIPRVVYVSTTQSLGDSGRQERDEAFKRQMPCRTIYEQSKTNAHEAASQYQHRGLPLVIVCPNSVIGANDHSSWGYFLRMYINRILPPICWSPDTIHGCVYVDDLAEGIALAAEKGSIGETYILSGERQSFRKHLSYWGKRPGAFKPLLWLPRQLAAAFFAPLEPFQRMLGIPAFISRETVTASSTNWNYSSAKAKNELGWQFRSAEEMWLTTIDEEIKLLLKRKNQNLLQRLKPLDIVN
jgi:dihydroflavonol-4-reductase